MQILDHEDFRKECGAVGSNLQITISEIFFSQNFQRSCEPNMQIPNSEGDFNGDLQSN